MLGSNKMKMAISRLRLSPNEEARIIREERERRRKLRIQQVREQHRYIALRIRQEVEQRRQQELEQLGKELQDEWERQQKEKIEMLQKLYHESLQLLGQGHRSAKENEPDSAAMAQKEEQNKTKAEERYREALKELKSQRLQDHERQSRPINARKKALQAEKERAAKVADLPLPPPNPIQNINFKKRHIVKKSDVSAFATTYYHMAGRTVTREIEQIQSNAHEEAEVEVRRLQEQEREEKRRRQELLEKAHLRGKQALRREHLEQDRERLLFELEHMQQTDLLRRRQQVSTMPPQIFQPLYQRREMREEDLQREMEFVFEDMYTGERKIKVDLVVQPVPEPLPALFTCSQDQELDVTVDVITTPLSENTQPDTEQEVGRTEQGTSAQVEPTKPAPRGQLKKFLDRIRSQRNHWAEDCDDVPTANSPNLITDESPERDTTIDTGSLTSNTHVPHEVSKTMQEVTQERKKRDEVIEREKQEQLALLQELEEQKAKLEEMLLEAQQEREQFKAAVFREVTLNQAEAPVCDQEVPPALTTELFPSHGEDNHTRRLREYQQRLLEQNRIHQRSVELAHQRLEEYQQALHSHYNPTAKTMQPPHLCHQILQSKQCLHFPAALPHPSSPALPVDLHVKAQTSVDIPTRESCMSASSPHPPGPILNGWSRFVPDQVQSISANFRDQQTCLTDNIMEIVTEHLSDRGRPLLVTKEPCKLFMPCHSKRGPLTSTSDPIKIIPMSITAGPPSFPVQFDTLPRGSVLTGSLRPIEDKYRQRGKVQETQRRILENREHKGEGPKWDVDHTRQEKATLQAWIHNTQTFPKVHSQDQVSVDVRHICHKLLATPLKAVEETSRGTFSQQEDPREEDGSNKPSSDSGEAPVQSGRSPHGSMLTEFLWPRQDDIQRQELQEAQRHPPFQMEAVVQQQRQRLEADMDEMRQQREMLQTLNHADVQPVPEAATEELVSEEVGQSRQKFLSSLLKAIEETNGGTLLHLLGQQEKERSGQQMASNIDPISQKKVSAGLSPASLHLVGVLPPPRPAKPPVSRVKLGLLEMTQHELSTIPEVETPGNTSQVTGPEDSLRFSLYTVAEDPLEKSKSTVASDWSLQSPFEQKNAKSISNSGMSFWGSCHLTSTERLLSGRESPPEYSDADSKITSSLSSYSGRGVDYSGHAVTDCRSPTESAHGAADSDSTTISTGSYITTDPEQNVNTDKATPAKEFLKQGADLLTASSPFSIQESSTAEPSPLAVDAVFSDSSIQHIIDKYTEELNISLRNTGDPTGDCWGSYVQESGSSVSEESVIWNSQKGGEAESSTVCLTLPSAVQRICQQCETSFSSVQDASQRQDSFRPMIGHLADQSSCLVAHHRDTALEQLLGQPSAHSSVIGQLPTDVPLSHSLDRSGWDSTLKRMIGRVTHQSSSQWRRGWQDFCWSHLMAQIPSEQSTTWLEGGPEPQMRPLAGEVDESAGQHNGSSVVPPAGSVLDVNPQPQNQTTPTDLDLESTEDSFHPLLAEVTHNETADPSMNSHLPKHHVHNSPEGQPFSWNPTVSTTSTENPSACELSPENFRTEESVSSLTACPVLHESFTQLISSQDHPCECDLLMSPSMREDASLSNLTLCDDGTAVKLSEPGVTVSNISAEELTSKQGSGLKNSPPVSENVLEAAGEKGILEESEITLVSLTDTTLQEQDVTVSDEQEPCEDKHPHTMMEEGRETQGTELILHHETHETFPVMLLEFQWGPCRGLQDVFQQKRRALMQRSSQRVEEIKAKRALGKLQSHIQTQSEAREQSEGSHTADNCKAKLESQQKSCSKSKGRQAEQHQSTVKSGKSEQKKTPSAAPVKDSKLNRVDYMKICTREQMKLDVSEMHQRTRRLCEQLEEVKHQKAIRNRQEVHANNQLKAKEFHKKMLQKLRAQQTLQ